MAFTDKKQKLLIEYLISSADTYSLCKSIVNSQYFDPEFRNTVKFIDQYYEQYKTTPSVEQIEAQTDLVLKHRSITSDQIEYCANEIETFCRTKAMEHAIIQSSVLLEKGENDKIEELVKQALTVSLNRDMGLNYFADPAGRLSRLMKEPSRTSTGWGDLDEMLAGGIARTEMILFSANSGGGKSIALTNMAVSFASRGFNVMYITLELPEDMVAQRIDTMMTGISTVVWKQKYEQIVSTIDNASSTFGEINIKRMHSHSTSNQIRAYIKDFILKNKYTPDLLIVDYLDLVGANRTVSADNVFEKDKQAAEQLRDIGFDFNMFIATASQQNRLAIEAKEMTQGHIAGGISKINTVDIYISIIMTDAMRAAGDAAFKLLKTRSSDGVGKTVNLKWNHQYLKFESIEVQLDPVEKAIKTSRSPSLVDLMSQFADD